MEKKQAAALKKRARRPNSVKGKRRGGRYPEEVKTAALADLLVCRNLSDVARRYGVPESTLRSWQKALVKGGEKDVFEKARLAALTEISVKAARGAALSAEYLQRRLEHAARTEELRDELADVQDRLELEVKQKQLNLRRSMDDGDAARVSGVLMGMLEKSQEMLQAENQTSENENELKVAIEVVKE